MVRKPTSGRPQTITIPDPDQHQTTSSAFCLLPSSFMGPPPDPDRTAPGPPPYRLACCKAPLSNLRSQNTESRIAGNGISLLAPGQLSAFFILHSSKATSCDI